MYLVPLFGPPAVGKSTLAKTLIEKEPGLFSYFSSGDLIRTLAQQDDEIGKHMCTLNERGEFLDDETMMHYFLEEIFSKNAEYLLLDGIPRTLPQMDMFKKMILEKHVPPLIFGLELTAPRIVLEERYEQRKIAQGREDDNKNAYASRYETFLELTQPVIFAYEDRKLVVPVVATRKPEDIADELILEWFS